MEEVVRVSKKMKALLEFYGDTVEQALDAIQTRIIYLEHELDKSKAVIEALQKVTPRSNEFIPASRREEHVRSNDVPVKNIRIIGKIEDDEKLEEPTGRQGRDVR
jgi:hypothetical protein